MNELYEETIERHGRIYHYDPDRDIYYAYSEESILSKWAWLVLCVLLALAAVFLEYKPGLV
jgi:hypothetical protein